MPNPDYSWPAEEKRAMLILRDILGSTRKRGSTAFSNRTPASRHESSQSVSRNLGLVAYSKSSKREFTEDIPLGSNTERNRCHPHLNDGCCLRFKARRR